MRLKTVLATAVALAAAMTFPTMASGATTDEALWGSSQTGNATTVADCGTNDGLRSVTGDGFCVIDDFQGAVELGVRFTTSRSVDITGVRVYRFDQGTVTGSLWSADGTRMATGTFAAWSGTGWQDLLFPTPVPIEPGQTYVASYNAPNADYAFEWNYFTDQSRTVGPITALQSTEADGNGVYCYVGQQCDMFPSNTYRDTNYWVTPLWSRYDFTGFFQPVDVDKLNTAKAGRAIPVKFSLGGDMGLGILKDGYPKATRITCETSTATGEIEGTTTAGSSSLSYDADADQYTYVWKSSKAWSNSCYRFELGLDDGSSHTFDVMFTR